jgi:hypothetical protein
MSWLIVFAIMTASGQVIRIAPKVEYPTEDACIRQGAVTFTDFRKQDWWAFFECQQQPQ